MDILVCTVCGSPDVELKAWVRPNEDCRCTHSGDLPDYLNNAEDCYCNNCGQNVTLKIENEKTIIEYEKNRM